MINVKNRIDHKITIQVRKELCDQVNRNIYYKLTMKVYAEIINQLKITLHNTSPLPQNHPRYNIHRAKPVHWP